VNTGRTQGQLQTTLPSYGFPKREKLLVPTIRFTTHACHTAENQSQISPGLKRFRICNAQNQIQCLTGSNPAVFGKRICAKKTWQPGAVLLQGIEIAIFGGNTYKNPNVFAGQFSQTALFQQHAGVFSLRNQTAQRSDCFPYIFNPPLAQIFQPCSAVATTPLWRNPRCRTLDLSAPGGASACTAHADRSACM